MSSLFTVTDDVDYWDVNANTKEEAIAKVLATNLGLVAIYPRIYWNLCTDESQLHLRGELSEYDRYWLQENNLEGKLAEYDRIWLSRK